MFIDKSIDDHSAKVAKKILYRGIDNMSSLLQSVCGAKDFVYVACPDFSISLRQRRLILGLPIGGYVNWAPYDIFPLELDVNSCGVHLLELPGGFDEVEFRTKLEELHRKMDNQEICLGKRVLKWNFSRRNHFIGVYKDESGKYYVVFHSSSETILFDWDSLHSLFTVHEIDINGRTVPYIAGKDVHRYWSIAKEENEFFFERHRYIFKWIFGNNYKAIFSDQHFGMIEKGEILMGCSKLRIGSVFPILTGPFLNVFLARAEEPHPDILIATSGYTLVPHGLGMTIPNSIVDIVPDTFRDHCVAVVHENGSRMITDTLEHIGIGYRSIDVIPKMAQQGRFVVERELTPVLCMKL